MSFCSIPSTLGGLGTAGDLAALGADIASANNGGSATPRDKATWAAVLLSAGGLFYDMQKKKSPFAQSLVAGTTPVAAVTQAAFNASIAFDSQKSTTERVGAAFGFISGVAGAAAGLLSLNPVPTPLSIALKALAISATAAQAIIENGGAIDARTYANKYI